MAKLVYQGKRSYEFRNEAGQVYKGCTLCILQEQHDPKNGYMPFMVFDRRNNKSKMPSVAESEYESSGINLLKPGDEIVVSFNEYGRPVKFAKAIR